MLTVNQISMFT